MYKKLVLSGGAAKGFAFIGVVQALEEADKIQEFEEFTGTSIGGFCCLLIILGYTSSEMKKIFYNFDFSKVIEYKLTNFIEGYGLDDGSGLEDFIKIFLQNKNIDKNITYKQLFTKYNKVLTTVSCNVNRKSVKYMNHENYPDLPVFKGIRMSMNLPFLFKPVEYMGELYIDGCMVSNFPIKYYTKATDDIFAVLLKDVLSDKSIDDIQTYITYALKCSLSTIEDVDCNYSIETIGCEPLVIYFSRSEDANFKINDSEKKTLTKTGYDKAKAFIEKKIYQPCIENGVL